MLDQFMGPQPCWERTFFGPFLSLKMKATGGGVGGKLERDSGMVDTMTGMPRVEQLRGQHTFSSASGKTHPICWHKQVPGVMTGAP